MNLCTCQIFSASTVTHPCHSEPPPDLRQELEQCSTSEGSSNCEGELHTGHCGAADWQREEKSPNTSLIISSDRSQWKSAAVQRRRWPPDGAAAGDWSQDEGVDRGAGGKKPGLWHAAGATPEYVPSHSPLWNASVSNFANADEILLMVLSPH